jgi:hypothetical protein
MDRRLTTDLRCATEFDFRVVGDGRSAVARYANNSNYRNDSLIRKESTRYPDTHSLGESRDLVALHLFDINLPGLP